ncbi:hypothetical protein CJ301_17840 [Limimaricola cinnabarinus]|uniref:Phospholipid/glycerol acyltransferase domain-containing protein n=1 Tax=Limimaricola cinnabarinus TaxID=1125964 RepID=A0A2G1MBQ4_9RHOB|nr:hypothetical protein CJ301_17840 [Limimaricola cinnabarinus]
MLPCSYEAPKEVERSRAFGALCGLSSSITHAREGFSSVTAPTCGVDTSWPQLSQRARWRSAVRRSHIARDISYAGSAQGRAGRLAIRTLELAGGRNKLLRRAHGYDADLAPGRDIWSVMMARFGLSLDVTQGALATIPATGPLLVVANHPYGILDGLIMGHLLSSRRGADFRILAHRVFGGAPEIAEAVLPVDFDGTRAAAQQNISTRAKALMQLAEGGAIGIFPGGTVSTSAKPFSTPLDPRWRNFTAKMAARPDVTVVPLYFEGTNSRLFQLASHVNYTLRMGLMLREFRARTNSVVRVAIGDPISRATLDAHRHDATSLMTVLRQSTYALSNRSVAGYGHEFERRYSSGNSVRLGDVQPSVPQIGVA